MKEKNEDYNQNFIPKTENKNEKSKTEHKLIFENGNIIKNSFNKNDSINKDNFIDVSQSQILPNKDNYSINATNVKNDLQTSSTNFRKNYLHHHHKKRLKVNLTEEEEIYYYNLFESLDTKNIGKLDSVPASSFLKKSGLSKHILKEIWLMIAKYSINHITRDEFYAALRLIALAQNNMPYTEESIEKNTPIPPLPSFKYKIKMNDRIIYKLTENNKQAFRRLFEKSKINKTDPDIISRKALDIWKSANTSDDYIRKIASILTPLEKKGHFNLKEFQVANYLISISDKYEIPDKLPMSLFNYLGRGEKNENNNNINKNEEKNVDKNIIDKKNMEECNENIREALRKAKELNKENDIINEKIILSKNKIKNLIEEIQNLEKEQDIIKQKLNSIYNGCSELIDFLDKNRNNVTAENKNININNNNVNYNQNNNMIEDNNNMIENNNNDIKINKGIQNKEKLEQKENVNKLNILHKIEKEEININNEKEREKENNNGLINNNNINEFMPINQNNNEQNGENDKNKKDIINKTFDFNENKFQCNRTRICLS